jgi:hypothetical protein
LVSVSPCSVSLIPFPFTCSVSVFPCSVSPIPFHCSVSPGFCHPLPLPSSLISLPRLLLLGLEKKRARVD